VNELRLSGSLVLYKPDFHLVEKTLLALRTSWEIASHHFNIEFEITLVDNSDSDQLNLSIRAWLDKFRVQIPEWSIRLISAQGNVGYGQGNNLVIEKAKSDYHFVINPDLFVRPDALLEALKFMESHQDVGLLSPAVFDENGERQYLCKRSPTLFIMFLRGLSSGWLNRFFHTILYDFEMRECNYEKTIDSLDYPTGCFMFFRTLHLQAIKGFDPEYFLHFEDADIGRRMQKVARVTYVPAVEVIHKWTRGSHLSWHGKLMTVRSGLLYWRKWGGTFRRTSREYISQTPYRSGANGVACESVKRVLVTGANGFIGQRLCQELSSRGYKVTGAVRQAVESNKSSSVSYLALGELSDSANWSNALSGVECVVHLAARVHVMRDESADPLEEFRRINTLGTERLARIASACGVTRLIYVSSIKVNGEETVGGHIYSERDKPAPIDPYGISKWEAEQALSRVAKETGLEIVIVRPPLVYGPGVKGNFERMLHVICKRIPLPFSTISNLRSLLYIDNLVDALRICVTHPAAVGKTYLLSDDEDISTANLMRLLGEAMGKPVRFFPVPSLLLKLVGHIIGKSDEMDRLIGSLQVDSGKIRRELNWHPPYSMRQGLQATADWYFKSKT